MNFLSPTLKKASKPVTQLLFLAWLMTLVSCGGRAAVPVHPVSGSVMFDGESPTGALVVLHPLDLTQKKTLFPRGTVTEKGQFRLTTRTKDDGAPAGDYRVTIVWRDQPDEDEAAGPNKLPRKYANPHTTPLRVKVHEGVTELPPIRIESE